MKRVQILLEDDLDEAIEGEAQRRGTSKAEVLRSLARDALVPPAPLTADPVFRMAGRERYQPADVDEVVYG